MTSRDQQQEEEEVAEFLPVEVSLDTEGLTLLDRMFRTLDHPRFRAMAPGKQLLYLQLLRWSYGQQQDAIEASRMQMSEWTGLAWDTIKKYIPSLIEDKLVKIIRGPTPVNPTMYEVYWLPAPLPSPTPVSRPENIAFYVDQFDADDTAEYARLERLLKAEERRQLQSEVSWSLRDLGIPWNYDLIKKLVMWQYLMRSPYRHRLEEKHPDWFTIPQ